MSHCTERDHTPIPDPAPIRPDSEIGVERDSSCRIQCLASYSIYGSNHFFWTQATLEVERTYPVVFAVDARVFLLMIKMIQDGTIEAFDKVNHCDPDLSETLSEKFKLSFYLPNNLRDCRENISPEIILG
jgi:hypothetical protein